MDSGAASIDEREIAKFSAMAAEWWDPKGSMKPLHRQNPARMSFLRDRVSTHFGLDPKAPDPFSGLTVLDVGCGGGLISEPLARLGAKVTGIDAAAPSIEAARAHAREGGLDIDYRNVTAEALLDSGETFDLVVSLEVIEHVADPQAFVTTLAGLVRPGGAMALSTLNRTRKAFLMAIVGAEYVLRWLPRGTHDWRKFLRPSEIAGMLRREGLQLEGTAGLVYNPLTESWRLDPRDLDVNYMLFAARPE
jgi:2-polyprenyl-6-hydroxyphenyl methylase/3-demethylubiquinone-9 3-methyltransferase